MKKNLIRDNQGTLDSAKIAFWLTLISAWVQIFTTEQPDYSGLTLFVGSIAALYFGRSLTKSKESKNV
jgi:hypothetical protein